MKYTKPIANLYLTSDIQAFEALAGSTTCASKGCTKSTCIVHISCLIKK